MFEQLDVQAPKQRHSSPGSLHTLQGQLEGPSTPIGDTVLTDTQDEDPPAPDYKPFALRWPFLTTLLLFICSLIILVIVGLSRLPIQKSTSFTQILLGRQIPERELGVPSGFANTEYGTHLPLAKSPSYEGSTDAVVINECQDWYFIRPEDNCTSIAIAHNTSVEQLYAWNPSVGSQCASLKPHSWLCVDSPSFAASLAPRQDWSTIDWSSALSTVQWTPVLSTVDWSTALATVDWSSVFNSFSTESPIWHCSPVSTMYCCFGTDGIPGACVCGGRQGQFTCTCTCGPTGAWASLEYTISPREGYAAIVTTASTKTDSMARSAATKTEAVNTPSPLSNHAETTAHLTTPYITALKPAKSPDCPTSECGDLLSNKAGLRAEQDRIEPNAVGQQSGSNTSSRTISMPPRPTFQTGPGTVHHVSVGSYFANMFMPVLLGILLHIPVHILSENVKLFQPLHEMTQPEGSPARHSLLFSTFSWRYRAASLRPSVLRHRSMLPLLTLALGVAANICTALSATAVGFQLRGGCHRGDPASVARGCGLEPSMSLTPALLLISTLAVMVLMVCTAIFLLTRWRTGVNRNPWSIVEARALSLHPGLRELLRPVDQGSGSSEFLKSNLFTLGYFKDEKGQQRYGIIPRATASPTCAGNSLVVPTDHDVGTGTDNTVKANPGAHGLCSPHAVKSRLPIALGYVERALFLVILSGLIILIVYYHNVNKPSSFENFMDGETFGVKFLFTLLGTVITSLWWSFFESEFNNPDEGQSR